MGYKNINQTLYVNLKTNLFFLFMSFGEIQQIIMNKNKKIKGQTFIIYKTTLTPSITLKTV